MNSTALVTTSDISVICLRRGWVWVYRNLPGTLQKLAEALLVLLLSRVALFQARQLSVLLQHLQCCSMHITFVSHTRVVFSLRTFRRCQTHTHLGAVACGAAKLSKAGLANLIASLCC